MKHELTILRIIGLLVIGYSVIISNYNFLFITLFLSSILLYGVIKYRKHIKGKYYYEKKGTEHHVC